MIGKTLAHYEILEPLGAGGMGEVYLGEDTRKDHELELFNAWRWYFRDGSV